MVDLESPSLIVTSPTHPRQEIWYADPQPTVELMVNQDFSGMAALLWGWDNRPEAVPKPSNELTRQQIGQTPSGSTQYTIHSTEALADGIWYFHAIAVDGAGNTSAPVHYRFQIDMRPPKASIHISKPVVMSGRPKPLRNIIPDEVPPRVNSGEVQIELVLSENAVESPQLFFQPSGKLEFTLNLTPIEESPIRWRTTLRISPQTGNGIGQFRFVAKDRAGNVGNEFVTGREVIIDTHIDANETQTQYRIGDDNAIVTIPPNALKSDVHLHLERIGRKSAGQIRYRLIAWNVHGVLVPHLTFAAPIELQLPIDPTFPIPSGNMAYTIYHDDGVRKHPIGTEITSGHLITRVSHTGEFLIIAAPKPSRKITGGWAAPNPFTPNNSGDASDRTIFHVQSEDSDVRFTIEIFDLLGRRIMTLRDGLNVWDGKDESGVIVPGGVYIYQIRTEDEVISGTVVVVR